MIGVALGLDLWAVFGFLVVYNVGHVALRWWALRAGWNHGTRVAAALHQPVLQRAAALSGPAMAAAVGLALPLAAQYLTAPFPEPSRRALAVVAAGGFLLLWGRRGTLTGLRFGLTLLALAALAAWLWR
jgi:PTS system mannose-specific IID component